MKASEIRLEITKLESSRKTFESIDPQQFAPQIEKIDRAIAAFHEQLESCVGDGWIVKRTAPVAQRNGLWVHIPELNVKLTIPPSLIEYCRQDPSALGRGIVRYDTELDRLSATEADKILEDRTKAREEYEKSRRGSRR